MKKRIYSAAFWFSVGLILAAEPVVMFAHHSFAVYDRSKLLTLKGNVKSFQWTNPHCVVWVLVQPEGTVRKEILGRGSGPSEVMKQLAVDWCGRLTGQRSAARHR